MLICTNHKVNESVNGTEATEDQDLSVNEKRRRDQNAPTISVDVPRLKANGEPTEENY